jgi:glycerophosphoryl diester phosphodiesterase
MTTDELTKGLEEISKVMGETPVKKESNAVKYSVIVIAVILFIFGLLTPYSPQLIAHRGSNGGNTDNIISGLQNSIARGYEAVECDLSSYQGDIYLSHDDITASNVNALDTAEELNTLVDSNSNTIFYIEIKEPATYDDIMYINDLFSDNKDNVIIQVSTMATYDIISNLGYDILVLQFKEYSVEQYVDFCNANDCYIGFAYYSLTENDLEYINNNFDKDIYWTIDNVDDYNNLLEYEPYGVMTNTAKGVL